MQTDKIIYMETIPTGSFANVRMGIEGILEPGESIAEAFKQAKGKISEAFIAIQDQQIPAYRSPSDATPFASIPIPSIDRAAIERLEILIDNCESTAELEGYFTQAEEYRLLDQYSKKHDQLYAQQQTQ